MSSNESLHKDQNVDCCHDDTTMFENIKKAVYNGLTKKNRIFHPALTYDKDGGILYENLCFQQEYYLFRAEKKLLLKNVESIMKMANPSMVVDLGCAGLIKTQIFINYTASRLEDTLFILCDFDGDSIQRGMQRISPLYHDIINFQEEISTFYECINKVQHLKIPKLFLFLGSTIGNFTGKERADFIKMISENMSEFDHILIGVDLVKKEEYMESAYKDKGGLIDRGVFQILRNMNKYYEADFMEHNFFHKVKYEHEIESVVSYLVSKVRHKVTIKSLDMEINIGEGEEISAEIHKKFEIEKVTDEFKLHKLFPTEISVDKYDRYALILFSKLI